MTLKQALIDARRILSAHDVEDFALESEILLRHVLHIGHVQMLLELDASLSPEQAPLFWDLIERRARGEPTAYLTGHREFYGIDFCVNHNVLIPRPESELLVEKAIGLAKQSDISTIADVGTGSGAIAIALALHLQGLRIYATDVSEPALAVARANCQQYGILDRVTLLCGDMLAPLPEPVDLIVANLPYVPESELIPGGPLSFEPALALNGGPDGLLKIRQLVAQLKKKPALTSYLLLEIGQGQKDSVVQILQDAFPEAAVETASDLGGIERVVVLTLNRVNDKLTTASHSVRIERNPEY